jgi:NAD(P)-dependent dehydrogenase (short-subunit alcohol dehydrogenase family)
MTIAQLGLSPDALRGETVIVTGAGGGIRYDAARALLWLGANVVIAEISQRNGRRAETALEKEFGKERVLFVTTDVGDEASVRELCTRSVRAFSKVDAVINNATIAVLGKVIDLPIEDWDRSYRVNLRGPVLMAKTFLPEMIRRNHGAFACVSSKGTAFLGGYESFKAAQLHLGDTLDAELEGTRVFAYTIGPGLVPTETASRAVAQLAPHMGMSVEAFFEANKGAVLSVEAAGAGFAASIVFAERFHGQEISSMQALRAADMNFGSTEAAKVSAELSSEKRKQAEAVCEAVRVTLKEQLDSWKSRSLFERQWVARDFKKTTGAPVEQWLSSLEGLL